MAPAGFHPVVTQWFEAAFAAATDAQRLGWPHIREGRHTLIAAPTGSGKTLAAFLVALDRLFAQGLASGSLPDETTVVYVSPLKALSTDVHVNLAIPRDGIRSAALDAGLSPPHITTATRTGDTPPHRRAAMTRKPPHILVTTPESLYLLLTAARSREALRTARCVIIDEIHAVLPSRRGAHLALSLERLDHVAGKPLQRIGLSATQKPVEEVARFLVGASAEPCAIVDLGHRRQMDLGIEVPPSPLDAVISHEVWGEIYDRLARLATEHGTTLVFVNARRMAERLARQLADRLGDVAVAAHHGSLSQDQRRDAERRLKEGALKVLVATASLELGIDIGSVDLVCQIGSPRSIATFLQRIGRAGHQVDGISKGRLFPLTRDDLVECVALLDALERGELESVHPLHMPLDVLCQQIVAEASTEAWELDALTELFRRAYPYRALDRALLADLAKMLARGFITDRGRRGALLYHDGVHHRIKGRPAARMVALTSGGAIPDSADYRVVQEPEDTFVGTVNEDFAIESIAGDIFQLGNTAWRILRVEAGVVRVEDAQDAPPTIPFWFGEAPARSNELSAAVARFRKEAEEHLQSREMAEHWLTETRGLSDGIARQIAEYLVTCRQLLGALPTQHTLILERFFDAAGGMQLVLHSPFGARINRAWGLALRKRFCRKFNFELQAAATENAILLSLGPQHSFPLEEVFDYLHPVTLRTTLVQAILDAPMFQTRWRWNLNIALAVPRRRGGKKVPPPLQRMQAEDILVAVFPDAAACLENVDGEREIPEHPLVDQTLTDCLELVMDHAGLRDLLDRLQDGAIRLLTCDGLEPSPLAHEILTASPFAFLDDTPIEERRTQAVHRRHPFEATSDNILDGAAILRVIEEVQPRPEDPDSLHDVLLTLGCLPADINSFQDLFASLAASGRAAKGTVKGSDFAVWLPRERMHEGLALWNMEFNPPLSPMEVTAPEDAAAEVFVRGLLTISGPVSKDYIAQRLGLTTYLVEQAVLRLEAAGEILRGAFTPSADTIEWCNRRLLARMHRYTLGRLRANIQPVSTAQFMRFLCAWQKATPGYRVTGTEGLYAVIAQLDGYSLQAAAWESDVLPLRVTEYDPAMLDTLCFQGRLAWGRLVAADTAAPVRSTPIALFLREHARLLQTARNGSMLSAAAERILAILNAQGASFSHALIHKSRLLPTQVEAALSELVAKGLASADGFAGLRSLLTPSSERRKRPGIESAGRWFLTEPYDEEPVDRTENIARLLLRRYGIVFRRLLAREHGLPPWRELVRIYWRLEARGEIRGGRFVAGVPGEHFALPEAAGLLRSDALDSEFVSISAADPLNLVGILTPGTRVPALATNRVLYRGGVPLAALVGGDVHWYEEGTDTGNWKKALFRQPESEALRRYYGRARSRVPRWEKKPS